MKADGTEGQLLKIPASPPISVRVGNREVEGNVAAIFLRRVQDRNATRPSRRGRHPCQVQHADTQHAADAFQAAERHLADREVALDRRFAQSELLATAL